MRNVDTSVSGFSHLLGIICECLTFGFLQFILPTVALASNELLLLDASLERS